MLPIAKNFMFFHCLLDGMHITAGTGRSFIFALTGGLQRGLQQIEIRQNQRAQTNAVPAEHLEIMLFHIVHQEPDAQHGNGERHGAAREKNSHFRAGKAAAVGQELDDLDETGSRHGGDGQEERELGRHRA